MFKSKISKTLIVLITSISFGCATLFTGSSDTVTVNSEPSGAKVYLNGMYMGLTPVSPSLKRDKDYAVILKKEGYQDTSANISRSFNLVSILNLGSILCWVVDLVTGAIHKFDTNGITVTMEKEGKKSALIPTTDSLVVVGPGLKKMSKDNRIIIVKE